MKQIETTIAEIKEFLHKVTGQIPNHRLHEEFKTFYIMVGGLSFSWNYSDLTDKFEVQRVKSEFYRFLIERHPTHLLDKYRPYKAFMLDDKHTRVMYDFAKYLVENGYKYRDEFESTKYLYPSNTPIKRIWDHITHKAYREYIDSLNLVDPFNEQSPTQ